MAKKKSGPKPETVKIHADWQDAITTALKKPRPAGGWPEEKPKQPKGAK